MDRQIAQWFQEGKYYEALMGEGDYFVMDHTYRSEHNVILVIYTMIKWAYSMNKVDSCSKEFSSALTLICTDNPIKALDVIYSYLIVSDDLKQKLAIKMEKFYELLERKLKLGGAYSDSDKRKIELLMKAIGKKVAAFSEWKP